MTRLANQAETMEIDIDVWVLYTTVFKDNQNNQFKNQNHEHYEI